MHSAVGVQNTSSQGTAKLDHLPILFFCTQRQCQLSFQLSYQFNNQHKLLIHNAQFFYRFFLIERKKDTYSLF